MAKGKFEGWYFKHQLGSDTIALIPGRSQSGAFVQLLTSNGGRYFAVPALSVKGNEIRAGGCLFSPQGCRIDLPGVSGEIDYGPFTPLKSDIMGPFRFFPMECRHGVISMAHSLRGRLTVDGAVHSFDGGLGYVEQDSGVSFPSSYQWLQCNAFSEPCALMISLARIPFGGLRFTGCICALIYGGHEFRLATYRGARILTAGETQICLAQKSLRLLLDIAPSDAGHPLKSPVIGCMTGVIRESANAAVRLRLWQQDRLLLDLHSGHGAYEYVKTATPPLSP